MPFIQALGYNVFNPVEVAPEFTADVAGLKGEKVDYAIMMDDQPIILIADCVSSQLKNLLVFSMQQEKKPKKSFLG